MSAFALSSVPGRGFRAFAPPADADDAPPNAGAAVLAEVRALETLLPADAGGAGAHARAWRELPTATLRVRVTRDAGAARGATVQAAPEGVPAALGDAFAAAPAFVALDEALLARASPEALAAARAAPPRVTEAVRRVLALVRPYQFQA